MITDSEQRFLGQQLFEPFTPAIGHRRDLISIAIGRVILGNLFPLIHL